MRWPVARLGLCLFVLAGCGGSGPVAETDPPAMDADQVIYGVRHVMTADGVRRAVLESDSAYLFEDSARLELHDVHLRLFDGRGEQTADLTSERGGLDTRTQLMVARGDVVLVTTEGDRRIETEELHFDPEGDRIWSDVETTLREDGNLVRGDGFNSDGRLRNLRVRNPTGRFERRDLEM